MFPCFLISFTSVLILAYRNMLCIFEYLSFRGILKGYVCDQSSSLDLFENDNHACFALSVFSYHL